MQFLRWFRPSKHLADTLHALEARVAELESLQLQRELLWRETQDKLLRYLKRVQEVERREGTGGNGSRAALMAAKFGRRSTSEGGG